MKPIGLNQLSAEDADVILKLAPILDIAFAKRLENASERKFYVETTQKAKRLVSVNEANIHQWAKDNGGYAYVAKSGIIVPQFIKEGFFAEGNLFYCMWSWLEGEDVSEFISRLNSKEQFIIGKKCGEIARKIHSLPPFGNDELWEVRCRRDVEKTIQKYYDKLEQYPECDILIKYLQDNIELLNGRPTTCFKGDWNGGNMIITPDGKIALIDGIWGSGDPWQEFWEVPNDAQSLAHFFTGQLHGYFDGEPPLEYFKLLMFYIALGYLNWYPDSAKQVLTWFDGMQNCVPSWFIKDYTVYEKPN